jgi:hypothetical protein
MTCDELELLLPDGVEDPDAQAHLAECAECRLSAEVLTMAAQPPPSASEKAKLAGLASAVQAKWSGAQRKRGTAQRFLGLAIAASVGAVIASSVMWKLNDARPPQVVTTHVEPEVLVLMEDSSPLPAPDDESDFEVSWPSLNEDGDVL